MNDIVKKLIEKNETIATMESCTGGEIVNQITNIEGASQILKFSAVTYSNEYKIKMGVNKNIIDKYSVYSMETAREMSKNISDFANSDYGIGITGKINKSDIFNPSENDDTIYIAIYEKKNDKYYEEIIKAINGSRKENKEYIKSVIEKMLLVII